MPTQCMKCFIFVYILIYQLFSLSLSHSLFAFELKQPRRPRRLIVGGPYERRIKEICRLSIYEHYLIDIIYYLRLINRPIDRTADRLFVTFFFVNQYCTLLGRTKEMRSMEKNTM